MPEPIVKTIEANNLVVASVLSGNRNFEGRINPYTKANYLASPPLVVAYAIAGTIDIDLLNDPIGYDKEGKEIMLSDIWPEVEEINKMQTAITPEMYKQRYSNLEKVSSMWNSIETKGGEVYAWDEKSTYIQNPPFFKNMSLDHPPVKEIKNARVLAKLGDSVTTDHISPAGAIGLNTPAAKYLLDNKVKAEDFNSYGSRRGNDQVMTRGTFANIRIRNLMVPNAEGGFAIHIPSGAQMTVFDASLKYKEEGIPLIVLAGTEYGTGSSRDWAAKGTFLLGVKAVVASSFERIHRSNLVGMGVLPLQFKEGQNSQLLGLTGEETCSIIGLNDDIQPLQRLILKADDKEIPVICRLDTPVEIKYYKNGGILHTVLRDFLKETQV